MRQSEQRWWESFETFYGALIGPFVKSYHLIYIQIMRVTLVDGIQGARIALKWQNYGFNEGPQGREIYWNIFALSCSLFNFFLNPAPTF